MSAHSRFRIFFLKILPVAVWLTGGRMPLHAQVCDTPRRILNKLEQIQVKHDPFFYAGSFPTYRRYGAAKKLKEDNAVFFTGLIAFTLKELRPYLGEEEQVLCDSVVARAVRSYPYFRNKNGRPTFNFWRTDPPLVFPHSRLLNHFNETQQLPDDLDDTAILWLSMHPSDSLARLVKTLMALHANGEKKYITNTYREYSRIPAYSTWFGEKMPIDFDFCVLCNVLYFVHAYHLPLNVHDSASVDLLRRMITDKYYLSHPAFIAPHYGRTPLLLYHIARLLGRFSIPALDSLKPELLGETYRAYRQADNWLDSALLSTAALRLGGKGLPVSTPDSARMFEDNATFFVASFSAILSRPWKKMLLHNQLIKYYYFCPAYRYTLYLENYILCHTERK